MENTSKTNQRKAIYMKSIKNKALTLLLTAALLLTAGCSNEKAETTSAEATTVINESDEADNTSAEANTPADDSGLTPAVWKVTDPESGSSLYMMGTIHIIPESEQVVPQYVLDIYEQSDGVAVEYDVTRLNGDMVAAFKYLSYFVIDDGTTITDHISEETYERAKEYLTGAGMYQEGIEAYNASYWSSMVSNSVLLSIDGLDTDGIDTYFVGMAKADGKEVRDIERLETQMEVITCLSDGYNEWSINSILDEISVEGYEIELEEEYMTLYNAWATGDTAAFEDISEAEDSEVPDEFAEEYAEYNRRLLPERNVGMADAAEQYIKNGDNIFYMVGFAHFCGEGSVIDLLGQRGYTVEKVY